MIKLINISPLNTTKEIEYFCEKCGDKGTFISVECINTDDKGQSLSLLEFECPNCNQKL
jgi:predicted SprT family Zn-dependent metalloprotease